MKIIDFLLTQNDEYKLAFLICCNEYDLPNYDQIGKCEGIYNDRCYKCWQYALGNTED